MKRIKINILIVFSLLFTVLNSGCKKDSMCNCLKKTGDEITETRNLAPFHSLEMKNNVDVIIVNDTFFSAKITCGKNLIDGIKTEVIDQQLIISNINKCNWLRDFENKFVIEVTVPVLEQVVTRGSGNLYCKDTIRGERLLAESWNGTGELNFLLNYKSAEFKIHTGPADMLAAGKLVDCYVYNAGNGFFKGFETYPDYCLVISKSTGDCEVRAIQKLSVEIEYNGNIYYKGNPAQIEEAISGKGQLIAK
ncbi:MAG: DUF2807 domain-containing protein [Bacteroidetes bacterium]|nr:DUF2807 domain-containing protein [Bacteroidota bacterium]